MEPSRELLLSTAKVNSKTVRVLLDDGSEINLVSRKLFRTLGVGTRKLESSANLSDGRTHMLHANDALPIQIGEHEDNFPFAVCELSNYDLINGKRWREQKQAWINCETNMIIISHRDERLSIMAALQCPDAIISRQQLTRALKRRMHSLAVFLRKNILMDSLSLNAQHLDHRNVKDKAKDELVEYADVFPEDLPAGLLLKRNHNSRIQLEEGATPHRSGIYRLSESELI